MTSPDLELQDVLGDAIVAQLSSDSITAEVVTNPTQGGSYPYVVIGESSESTDDTNKDKLKSSIAVTAFVHSDSLTEAKTVARSVLEAMGPNGSTLTLASHTEIANMRELEANDSIKEYRPEGDLFHQLIRVRFLISHN